MGAGTSTDRKVDEIIKVLAKKFEFEIHKSPAVETPPIPNCVFARDDIVVAQISPTELFVKFGSSLNLFSIAQWTRLLSILKRLNIQPSAIEFTGIPDKYIVYDRDFKRLFVNLASGEFRFIEEKRGIVFRQFLIWLQEGVLVFYIYETDKRIEHKPFGSDSFIASSSISRVTQEETGLAIFSPYVLRSSVLAWYVKDVLIPIHHVPELLQNPGTEIRCSLTPVSGRNPSITSLPHHDIMVAIDEPFLPDTSTFRVAGKEMYSLFSWQLNAVGKTLLLIVRPNDEAILMLCRPQVKYSQFHVFQN